MKKYTLLQIIGLLLALVSLTGCLAGKQVSTTALSAPGEAVNVQLESQLDGQGAKMDSGYSHPHTFTHDEMAREIDSLVVKQFDMGAWNKKSSWVHKPLFTRQVAEELPDKLVAAFARAGRSDAVAFTVPGRNNTQTRGAVFVKDNTLTWKLYAVDGMPYTGSDEFWMDNNDWRVEDAPQFTFYEDKDHRILTVVRNLEVKKDLMDRQAQEDQKWRDEHYYTDTTTAEPQYHPAQQPAVAQPIRETAAPAPVAAPEQPVKFQSMEEKLDALKKWADKGLISKEEYAREKDKILNKLQ